MSTRRKVNFARILISLLALFFLLGGGIYFYLKSKVPDYTVTFYDSKRVSPGAKVILSGIEAGTIVSVKPLGVGVAVGVKVNSDYRAQLTDASRFFLEGQGEGGRLLVKNLRSNGKPLDPGQIVEGTDSSIQWAAYDYARGMNDFFSSKEFREAQQAIRSYVEDIDQQLSQMDWDKLGKEMQRQMEAFSRQLEEALNDKDVQNFQQEIEKSFHDALEALDRAQSSQEAKELRQAIENFYRKLQEEFPSSDAPAQKSAS